tara:strand:- start:1642 stop:2301 length:660 start_codon:yes stop_codon:yes gene_type:complete
MKAITPQKTIEEILCEQSKTAFSTCWPFQKETVHSWAYWKQAFTKEECEKVVKIAKSYNLKKAGVIKKENKVTVEKEVRETNVMFLVPSRETEFIFKKLTTLVLELNQRFFNFDLWGLYEGLQFTNYVAPSGKYYKHIDKIPPEYGGIIRKLSFSLQLSNPKEYKGGNLNLHLSHKKTVLSKEQGALLVFPSYTMHEVTRVTKGERNSLVGWISGPTFR